MRLGRQWLVCNMNETGRNKKGNSRFVLNVKDQPEFLAAYQKKVLMDLSNRLNSIQNDETPAREQKHISADWISLSIKSKRRKALSEQLTGHIKNVKVMTFKYFG